MIEMEGILNMYDENQYKKLFAERLYTLRQQHNVSAREMSLSLGHNSSYINRIESNKNYPSLREFFSICEYLKISPSDFLDFTNEYPHQLYYLIENLKSLSPDQLSHISNIVADLVELQSEK